MNRQVLQDKIEELGFLSYVEPENLEFVRAGLLDNILTKQAFFFPHGDNFKNINGRIFSFDAEHLTEGGAIDLFNDMRFSMEKAGLQIQNAEQVFDSNTNPNRLIYKFILNNKTCDLAKVPHIFLLVRGLVTRKYAKFLNRVLRKARLKERIYFMNDSCSDTDIALLTTKQAAFVNSLKLNPYDRVYTFSYWAIFKPFFQIIGIVLKAIFKKRTNG